MGLGSKVSTCDGPPFMNRKMTRLARAGKCGGRDARGFKGTSASDGPWLSACAGAAAGAEKAPASASTLVSPRVPNPPPMRHSISRREKGRGEKSESEE